MAPPLPPPRVPGFAGLAPQPIARLWAIRLSRITHETPMLLSAPPFEHTPRRPPRAKMAPPPPPSKWRPVEFPSAKVRFRTVSRGVDWSWQCDVVHTWCGSPVSMYRTRRPPPPLSVTFPPPSRLTRALVLRTLAVAVIVMVTGSGPQEKVIMPPAATAATTACDVQLAAVPSPMTRAGTEPPEGEAGALPLAAAREAATGCAIAPQAETAIVEATAISSTAALRMDRMGPHASRGASDCMVICADLRPLSRRVRARLSDRVLTMAGEQERKS